ncbi:MAG TPA: anhydro-N-acetylmuramic acid kinase, partial [Stellaceae bacterium]|nr:anhydro-N-acetylmuramic acid kinase [Stellaceae bacterium]
SLDGIDAAFIRTDGRREVATGPSLTLPYADALKEQVRATLGGRGPVMEVERALTLAHAHAVKTLIARHELGPIDVIGFHGHTILHRPAERRTWQIGDGAYLADLTGIDVVGDFRSRDVAAGGQGAPLVPLFHAALASALERPLAILNIGGVANLTWLGESDEEILAFDTGPGNALLDDWALHHTGVAVDEDGRLARAGRVDFAHLERFLAHSFFAEAPPKSLDRDDFAQWRPDHLSAADGAATLAAMTTAAIARAAAHFPGKVRQFLVTGGGRHNPVLMAGLAQRLGLPVAPVEAVGWDGDGLEAQAFAYLAVRSLAGLPLSLPTTTGVPTPLTGGTLFRRGV